MTSGSARRAQPNVSVSTTGRWSIKNQEKIKQRKTRYRAEHQDKAREYTRRYRATHPREQRRSNKPRPNRKRNLEKARQHYANYLQRTDRPCKLSKAGCTELAVKNSRYCREHRADADRRPNPAPEP